jgi:hypothetical protein
LPGLIYLSICFYCEEASGINRHFWELIFLALKDLDLVVCEIERGREGRQSLSAIGVLGRWECNKGMGCASAWLEAESE